MQLCDECWAEEEDGFLCDMGVCLKVVQWLRKQGHEVTHLRDEGLLTLPDGEIFSKALSENRVIRSNSERSYHHRRGFPTQDSPSSDGVVSLKPNKGCVP